MINSLWFHDTTTKELEFDVTYGEADWPSYSYRMFVYEHDYED